VVDGCFHGFSLAFFNGKLRDGDQSILLTRRHYQKNNSLRVAMTMKIGIRCMVSGKVQGVYFRATAREQARRLGVTGWVRNTPDGQVELVACGTPGQIEQLRAWLWRGPEFARVTDVAWEEVTCEEFGGFEIYPTPER
jgi:acylphosphatase